MALAGRGIELGHGGPFGAVVVRDGVVVGEGWNEVLRTKDPTAHAEVVAIRNASRELATYDLSGCEIYASCEPCPMCLGAIRICGPRRCISHGVASGRSSRVQCRCIS